MTAVSGVTRAGLAGLLWLAALASGCTSAVVADTQLRSGRAVPEARLAAVLPGQPKGAVLAALGPPFEVLSPSAGDVFVYRVAHVDQLLVQLNTNLFGGPDLPLWADYDGVRRDETAFVYFDADGLVTQIARRLNGGWEPEP